MAKRRASKGSKTKRARTSKDHTALVLLLLDELGWVETLLEFVPNLAELTRRIECVKQTKSTHVDDVAGYARRQFSCNIDSQDKLVDRDQQLLRVLGSQMGDIGTAEDLIAAVRWRIWRLRRLLNLARGQR